MKTDQFKLSRLYWLTAVSAIITAAILTAFTAKSPTTLVMWVSAYLTLVVGMTQVFLGLSVIQLVKKSATRSVLWVFGLFNAGNALVIVSTLLKYSHYDHHLVVTIAGALLIALAMIILGRQIRQARPSTLRSLTYAVIAILISSSLLGLVLTSLH